METDELREKLRLAADGYRPAGRALGIRQPVAPWPVQVRLPDGTVYDVDSVWPTPLAVVIEVVPCTK